MSTFFKRVPVILLVVSVICVNVCLAKINIVDIPRMGVFRVAVLRNHKPVVVYFTKSSCNQCTKILNDLEDIARENDEAMYLARIDLDQYPELRKEFGIHTIPTTRTFYKGQQLRQVVGPLWGPIKAITNHALKVGKEAKKP